MNTVTVAVPADKISAADIEAVKRPDETRAVGRSAPFHRTTERELNPLPLTVSVKADPPAFAALGFRPVVVGTGL